MIYKLANFEASKTAALSGAGDANYSEPLFLEILSDFRKLREAYQSENKGA